MCRALGTALVVLLLVACESPSAAPSSRPSGPAPTPNPRPNECRAEGTPSTSGVDGYLSWGKTVAPGTMLEPSLATQQPPDSGPPRVPAAGVTILVRGPGRVSLPGSGEGGRPFTGPLLGTTTTDASGYYRVTGLNSSALDIKGLYVLYQGEGWYGGATREPIEVCPGVRRLPTQMVVQQIAATAQPMAGKIAVIRWAETTVADYYCLNLWGPGQTAGVTMFAPPAPGQCAVNGITAVIPPGHGPSYTSAPLSRGEHELRLTAYRGSALVGYGLTSFVVDEP